MFRKKKKKRPEISAPKNFEHRVHTSFDAKRGVFVGLPTQWQSLIENLRRPKPMVDPSRITPVELKPKKVPNAHTSLMEGHLDRADRHRFTIEITLFLKHTQNLFLFMAIPT